MSDIVERAWKLIEEEDQVTSAFELLSDEIERLRAALQKIEWLELEIAAWKQSNNLKAVEIERLGAVLRAIAGCDDDGPILARRALEPKP